MSSARIVPWLVLEEGLERSERVLGVLFGEEVSASERFAGDIPRPCAPDSQRSADVVVPKVERS
jgi:hypothetical protein